MYYTDIFIKTRWEVQAGKDVCLFARLRCRVSSVVLMEENNTDESWYCDAGPMSIPLYHGREARIRLELRRREQPDQELRPDEVKMWDDQQDREVRRWLGPPKFRNEEE